MTEHTFDVKQWRSKLYLGDWMKVWLTLLSHHPLESLQKLCGICTISFKEFLSESRESDSVVSSSFVRLPPLMENKPWYKKVKSTDDNIIDLGTKVVNNILWKDKHYRLFLPFNTDSKPCWTPHGILQAINRAGISMFPDHEVSGYPFLRRNKFVKTARRSSGHTQRWILHVYVCDALLNKWYDRRHRARTDAAASSAAGVILLSCDAALHQMWQEHHNFDISRLKLIQNFVWDCKILCFTLPNIIGF